MAHRMRSAYDHEQQPQPTPTTAHQVEHTTSTYTSRLQPPLSMQPTYPHPSSSGHGGDSYRAPQPALHAYSSSSSTTLPSINLPPIRSIDAQPQLPALIAGPPRYPSHPPPHQASPMLQHQPAAQYPHSSPVTSYYAPPPLPPPHLPAGIPQTAHQLGYGAPPAQPANALYPLPPQMTDQRAMSGGRHKKEIKRRTKTGCLTCRKRRIKCDEEHPSCRNCQKSKRECLGYDPIFKQQSSPAQLQPAPSPTSQAGSSTTSSLPPVSQLVIVSQTYAAPGGQVTAQPSSSYGLVDPTLGADAKGMPHPQTAQHGPTDARDQRHQPPYEHAFPPGAPARIDDLMSVNGYAPPSYQAPAGALPAASVDEVRLVYARDYATGLDRLLETEWYSRSSWPRLLQDQQLLHLFDHLLHRFRTITSDDFTGIQVTRSLETKVVWELLSLPRSALADPGPTEPDGAHQLQEARMRLDALEALLTNRVLARNPLLDVQYDYQLPNSKHWEVEFWRLLGQFVAPAPPPSAAGDPATTSQTSTEDTLQASRNILAMLENRDVLFSTMICRLFGPRLPDWPGGVREAHSNDPNDMRTKVCIAKKFIEDEAGGKGTNQVIQRICGMAVTAWHLAR